jgi:hypothetical protein
VAAAKITIGPKTGERFAATASISAQDSNGRCSSAPRRRVIDTEFRRVDLDHSPDDCPREHLAERLRRVEAVTGRERDPPGGDLLRAKLTYRPVAEGGNRLPEQPAQLLDRHLVDVVLRQVRLHQIGEGQRSREPPLPPQQLELPLQSLRRIPLRGEPATLHALRAAAAHPVAERPQRRSVATRCFSRNT